MPVPVILASVAGGLISSLMQRATGAATTSPASADTSSTVKKDDFLRVMAAQMQSPQAINAQGAVQPWQGTSVAPVGSGGLAGASALLGKTVTVNGSSLTLGDGSPGSLRYGLSGAANSVTIEMTDATGKVVRTMHVGQQGRGLHRIVFDGLSDDGQKLPSGQYTYRVTATDGTGNVLPGTSTGVGPVLGIATRAGMPWLQVGKQYVPLSAIVGVSPRVGV